jgi:hypothetical protein
MKGSRRTRLTSFELKVGPSWAKCASSVICSGVSGSSALRAGPRGLCPTNHRGEGTREGGKGSREESGDCGVGAWL